MWARLERCLPGTAVVCACHLLGRPEKAVMWPELSVPEGQMARVCSTTKELVKDTGAGWWMAMVDGLGGYSRQFTLAAVGSRLPLDTATF